MLRAADGSLRNRSLEKHVEKQRVFNTFFRPPSLWTENHVSKVGVLSARDESFLEKLAFRLHGTKLFNCVFSGLHHVEPRASRKRVTTCPPSSSKK